MDLIDVGQVQEFTEEIKINEFDGEKIEEFLTQNGIFEAGKVPQEYLKIEPQITEDKNQQQQQKMSDDL